MERLKFFTAKVLRLMFFPILLLLLVTSGLAQTIPADSLYRGQLPPGNTPKIFPLSITSGLIAAERIAITSDNKEIYYGELNNWPASSQRIKYYKYSANKWQGPYLAFEGYIAPSLSVNDSVMYMQKNVPNNSSAVTYYSRRTETGWSTPQKFLSTTRHTHYCQETLLKNYYLASTLTSSSSGNSDICKLLVNTADSTIQSLGTPINSAATENDFFIARDESYLIFCRFPANSASDLFISYKKDNGKWTNPKTLGIQVNTPNPNWEACPFVTQDNKYLFFMRGGNAMSSYHIYWVAIDNLIDSLKQTNFIPYLKTPLKNLTDSVGFSFHHAIPEDTFIDDDGNNTLTYSAKLSNGNPIPSWLTLDPIEGVFTGTPTEAGSFILKVTATDDEGATVFSTFTLRVNNSSSSIEQTALESIKVFPNPTIDNISISFGTLSFGQAVVKVTDLVGKELFSGTIDTSTTASVSLAGNPKGIYLLSLNIEGIMVHRKIFLE